MNGHVNVAMHIDRRPRLCDPDANFTDPPVDVAFNAVQARILTEARRLSELAETTRDRRGVLITYRNEADWVCADAELSDEVARGQIESRRMRA